MATLKVIKNRALTLATAGLLTGSPFSIATHGLLQVPQIIELPVEEVVTVPTGGGSGGGTNVPGADFWLGVPEHFKYAADLRLLLRSDTLARLKPPITIEKLEPTGLHAYFDAQVQLHLISESEWRYFDWQAEDNKDIEEILILLAARLLKEDEPIFWNEPNDS